MIVEALAMKKESRKSLKSKDKTEKLDFSS